MNRILSIVFIVIVIFETNSKASDTIRYAQLSSTKRDSIIRLIDSINQANTLENKLKNFESMLFEKPAIGVVDIDPHKIIHYNERERLCLGLGVYSNEKLAKHLSTGGYFTYGFGNKKWNYGATLSFFKKWNSFENISFRYKNDVSERGSIHFLNDHIVGSTSWLRDILVFQMDPVKEFQMSVAFQPTTFLLTQFSFLSSQKHIQNYSFIPFNIIDDFQFSEIGFNLKYVFREQFKTTKKGKIVSIGSSYPMFWFNYLQGIKVVDGDFRYSKLEMKMQQTIPFETIGKLKVVAIAGFAEGKTPICNLYNGNGSFRPFTIETENSFATMGVDEFYSSQFASLFLKHNFGTLLWENIVSSPEFSIVTNMGIGTMKHSEYQSFTNYKTLDKGYFESGFLIENLFGALGCGMYYRYGSYQMNRIAENIAYRLTFSIKY